MIIFNTVSGRKLDLANFRPADVDVRAIAHGLSHLCRFAGQTRQFYSVAQHACIVARVVRPDRLRFAALHHDDTEAFVGDLSSKIKHSPGLEGYRVFEDRLERVIQEALGLHITPEDHAEIKLADNLAAIYEYEHLMRMSGLENLPPIDGPEFWKTFPERVYHAVETSFVSCSNANNLYPLIERLPRKFSAWNPEFARDRFFQSHAAYQAMRWEIEGSKIYD